MKFVLILFTLTSFLFAESLGIVNSNYKQTRIKSKAKKSNSNSRLCYIYVDIDGRKEWNRYKHELNTQIKNNQTRCKKYVIYKIVKNVNTKNWRTSSAKNNGNNDYDINLGAIVRENANVDIELHTIVKNSKIQNGWKSQEANTGVVVNFNDNIDVEQSKYKVNTQVQNSQVGKKNFIEQKAIDMSVDFLKNDIDSPFD